MIHIKDLGHTFSIVRVVRERFRNSNAPSSPGNGALVNLSELHVI